MNKKLLTRIGAALISVLITSTASAHLIAYYPFDGNANDVSGNANNPTAIVGAVQALGYTGQAYDFSGSSYIEIPIDINPSSMPTLTMGAWVQTDVLNMGKVISNDNIFYDRTLGLDNRGGALGWSAFTGAGVLGNTPAYTGTWNFIAVTYDQVAGNVVLYIDGITQSTNATQGSGYTTTFIGKNPGFGEFFDGRIDNVFFYDEVLGTAALDNIRLNGISAVPVPAAVWLFGSGLLGLMGVARRKK